MQPSAQPWMPVLRKQHKEAFARAGEDGFVQRTVAHLREHHPDAVSGLDDKELERRVRIGLARGRAHGLEQQNHLTQFVALMFEIAPNFDRHPAVAPILADQAQPAEQRMEKLRTGVAARQWMEARNAADPGVWKG